MTVSIFEVLKDEHEEAKPLMESLAEEYDERGFETLSKMLEAHMEAEEEVLYKRLRDESATHDTILEGFEEHRVAGGLMRELRDQKRGTDLWMARMKVLMDSVEHHIEEEETQMFPAAQGLIPADEARAMAEEFESAKKRVRTHA